MASAVACIAIVGSAQAQAPAAPAAKAGPAPKGYWLVNVDVTDQAAVSAYFAANQPVFRKCGATYLVRGGQQVVLEGQGHSRTALLEFKDYPTALACYHSPEYQAVKKLREGATVGVTIMVEGLPPTP